MATRASVSLMTLAGWLASVVFVWALPVNGAWADAAVAAPPALSLTLHPQAHDGEVTSMAVDLHVDRMDVEAGGVLLRMPTLLVSTPTAAYTADQIDARDAHGRLKLTAEDEPPTPTGNYRRYRVDRAVHGPVDVHYATPPRAVSVATRNGPLFDLRRQQHGVMGAGVYFLALPDTTAPYRIALHWDLGAMPPGSRGIWSRGEGDQQTVAPAELLRFSFYAAGPIHSLPNDGAGTFSMYWLDTPPFDMPALARQTGKVYHYMAHFFGDDAAPYRVFARSNPYPAGGGTALAGSFMFGYGAQGQTIPAGPQMLLAHEMAHTWPRLDDEEHALTAWYTEGTAEFYSIVLSARAGVIDLDQFLAQINDRADGYYGNPYRGLSNSEAGKLFWHDGKAQEVPYGRGFMYFVRLDSQIRAHSGGKRSVDDLILEVLRRQRAGDKVGVADWKAMVEHELGPSAGDEFEQMVSGETLVPAPSAFGCFEPVALSERPFDLGFDEMRMGEVNDLEAGSAAAEAGLRDGDRILSSTPLAELKADPSRQMQIRIRRGQDTLTISYLPRAAVVDGWRWRRRPGSADAQCRP